MSKTRDIFEHIRKKDLEGYSFSAQDIFDCVDAMGIKGLILCWDDPCNISFFFEEEKDSLIEAGYMDLEEWEGFRYFIIEYDHAKYKPMFEKIADGLLFKFGFEALLTSRLSV